MPDMTDLATSNTKTKHQSGSGLASTKPACCNATHVHQGNLLHGSLHLQCHAFQASLLLQHHPRSKDVSSCATYRSERILTSLPLALPFKIQASLLCATQIRCMCIGGQECLVIYKAILYPKTTSCKRRSLGLSRVPKASQQKKTQ